METERVQSKLLIPPARRNLIQRPDLFARLDAGLSRRLTLISAPAGFGKTTLVVEWLKQVDRPAAWVSLDESESDVVQFFTYAADAARQAAGVGGVIQELLRAPQALEPEKLAAAFINDCAAAKSPFLLVLDDYHVITGDAVHRAVAYIADHLPAQLHVLISSRTDPLLPLPRLRARGQLTELRAQDLRLGHGQAGDFLRRVMGLELLPEQVSMLEARTEGWIAGLQMAALSIQGLESEADVNAFVADFAGSHRYIFDFLTDEVLQRRPPNTRAFLLETSILDRFNASLCAAVTGREESAAILESLERANFFLVPLDENRQWYRYHQLFAAFLQHRLRQYRKHEREMLHLRAASWLEANESLDQAIAHYGQAKAYQDIVRLIKQHGTQNLQPGRLPRLQRWLDTLPPARVRTDPWLAVLQAWICYLEQQTARVAVWVDLALSGLDQIGDSMEKDDGQLGGSIAGLRSWLAAQQGDFERAAHLAEVALRDLTGTDPFWRGMVTVFWGQALFGQGRTTEAFAAYEEALRCSDGMANWISVSAITHAISMSLTLRGRLSEALFEVDKFAALLTAMGRETAVSGLRLLRLAIHYERNDLDEVEAELTRLRPLAQYGLGLQTGRYQYLAAIYYAARGDDQEALDRLLLAEEDVSLWAASHEQALAKANIMRVYLRLGALQKPLEWLASLTFDSGNLSFLRISEYLAVADIARFREPPQAQREALALLETVHTLCDEAQVYGVKIDAYCLQALLRAEIGDEDGAAEALGRAVLLAEPERYTRTIVDFGPHMARLLQNAGTVITPSGYAARLLAQFPAAAGGPRISEQVQQPVEALSARELQVLSYLTTHLSGPEIADRLSISPNTLKTHVKHIYGKLGVHGRHDAVIRARDLKLLV